MQNKNPLSYTKTETASQAVNKQTSELLQKDFRNVQVNIENNDIEELKRKIDTITRYQKPYISKMLNNLLLANPINAKIICN